MPGLTSRYQDTPETGLDLPWAELVSLRLSQFDKPGGKQALAKQLKAAIHNVGFFYLTDFGLSEEQVNEQFERAADIFDEPIEDKMKVAVNEELPGGPLGYRPQGMSELGGSGLRDTLELYDDPKYNSLFESRARPATCVANAQQNEKFCKHLHNHVLYRLLVLTAIIMEMEDEEALWRLHNYDSMSNCHMRYMSIWPRPPEEAKILAEKGGSRNIAGHTDFGSFTLLFRQPVVGLQVKVDASDAEWKWVKPAKHSITVNVADTLSFLTGGYLKSSIHRVVAPPEDQRANRRLSVIYFSRPDDDVPLDPVDSPLLRRVGNTAPPPPGGARTAKEWVNARYASIGQVQKSQHGEHSVNGVTMPGYS